MKWHQRKKNYRLKTLPVLGVKIKKNGVSLYFVVFFQIDLRSAI